MNIDSVQSGISGLRVSDATILFIRWNVSEHLITLRHRTSVLRTRLSAKSVARFMFQRDALTYDELKTIESEENGVKAADILLQIVANELDREVYECFLKALKTTSQLDIYTFLNPGRWLLLN
jgi:hypothetical protein